MAHAKVLIVAQSVSDFSVSLFLIIRLRLVLSFRELLIAFPFKIGELGVTVDRRPFLLFLSFLRGENSTNCWTKNGFCCDYNWVLKTELITQELRDCPGPLPAYLPVKLEVSNRHLFPKSANHLSDEYGLSTSSSRLNG